MAQGGEGLAAAHEHVEHGVQHVVEQHQQVGQLGQRLQARPARRAQRQVQGRRHLQPPITALTQYAQQAPTRKRR